MLGCWYSFNMAFPREFVCPISMDLMTDPFVGNDGQTYERSAIETWISQHRSSPFTRQPMTLADLHPNFALRAALERWKLTNDPIPDPVQTLVAPQTKSFEVKGFTTQGKHGLSISTSHSESMETVLIAVLDVSGSMDSQSSLKSNSEGAQFSRLDLVKHSMKTLATLVSQHQSTKSSMAILTFSSSAQIRMPVTSMDSTGLQTALTTLDSLVAGGGTNIWEGLRLAFVQADTILARNPNINIQILLLTDGEPSPEFLPPLGIEATVRRKMATLKGPITLSTFGFGYNLDADLLESLCEVGNGTYGFIPDCSMVGTVFINWAAKALLTVAHHIRVTLADGSQYAVGDLMTGCKQSVILDSTDTPNKVTIEYDSGLSAEVDVLVSQESCVEAMNYLYLGAFLDLLAHVKRAKTVAEVPTQALLTFYEEILKKSEDTGSSVLADMVLDIQSSEESEGQILKACSKAEWWSTWGRNHCIAYYRAVKLRHCVNFKDKLLQHFSSPEFKELQEKGIDIFSELPPPQPTASGYGSFGSFGSFGSIGTVSMTNFVNSSGPCFTGDCTIEMENGETKYVKQLLKGDKVKGGHSISAVLYTPVDSEVDMIQFPTGLTITHWHPMKITESEPWVFPIQAAGGNEVHIYVDGYYNLVLDSGHVVYLNSYPVVTLGHGFDDSEVIRHPYFGTQAVIEDLKKHPDWDFGILVLDSSKVCRNPETGLIQSLG